MTLLPFSVAFVDNVLVGTETEEGHDKVVEEVLRRLEVSGSVSRWIVKSNGEYIDKRKRRGKRYTRGQELGVDLVDNEAGYNY